MGHFNELVRCDELADFFCKLPDAAAAARAAAQSSTNRHVMSGIHPAA